MATRTDEGAAVQGKFTCEKNMGLCRACGFLRCVLALNAITGLRLPMAGSWDTFDVCSGA